MTGLKELASSKLTKGMENQSFTLLQKNVLYGVGVPYLFHMLHVCHIYIYPIN